MTTDMASEKATLATSAIRATIQAQELPIEEAPRGTGIDPLALLTLALVIFLYHVAAPELRESTPIGLSLRDVALRRVLTVVMGFGAFALVAVAGRSLVIKRIAGAILALYVAFVGAFTFLGFEEIQKSLGSSVPLVMEVAAILSVIALWQPWMRLNSYQRGLRKIALPLVVFIGVLVVWEGVISIFQIKQFLLPAPSVILNMLVSVYPRLVGQGWFTFQNALWGFAIGCGVGILFGLVSARFIAFSRAMLPYAIAANSIPIIAISPIMNQWFGVTNPGSKIAVVAVLTFFPAMINTVRGLTSTSLTTIELMHTYAATEIQIFLKVRFLNALPYIFNALKVASTLSMIGALVAEYFGGPAYGLGVNIADNAALSKFPLVWAQIVIASLLGLGLYFVVSLVERLVMPWHVSFRPQTD